MESARTEGQAPPITPVSWARAAPATDWLSDTVNAIESATGLDLDGDGKVGGAPATAAEAPAAESFPFNSRKRGAFGWASAPEIGSTSADTAEEQPKPLRREKTGPFGWW